MEVHRPEIPRPSHFSIKDDGSSLRISFRWIWRSFIGPAKMCFLWNSFLVFVFWMLLRACPLIWLIVIFGIPHFAIGLLLVYATLAGFLNHTVIKITSESLSVRHGPVPWWGNRSLPIDDLERLYCHRHVYPESVSGLYCLSALTKAGNKVDLVEELDSVAEALFLKQELKRWLKIDELETASP